MAHNHRPRLFTLSSAVICLLFFGTGIAFAGDFISPEALDAYLRSKHSPLADNGFALVIDGLAYNVDPRLIVGIANAETSLGQDICSGNEFNAWSWFWNGPCPNSPLTSFEAGIRGVTKDIRYRYFDIGKTDIASIGAKYCAVGCEHWVKNVTDVFLPGELGGDPTELHFQPTRVFFDDMEGSVSGWTATGFWHVIDSPERIGVIPEIYPSLVTLGDGYSTYVKGFLPPAKSNRKAWWYGEDSTGTYIGSDFRAISQTSKDGGISTRANRGELISPVIDLTGFSRAFLVFFSWWEIESVDANSFDIISESIKVDVSNGGTFNTVSVLNPQIDVNGPPDIPYVSGWYGFEPFNSQKAGTPFWTPAGVDLSPYAGTRIRIKFTFDTRDPLYNGFRGLLIDDIAVFGIH